MPAKIKDLKKWLQDNSVVDPKTKCWNWTKSKSKYGYASINIKHDGIKFYRAHRLSFYLFKDSFDDSLVACHSCDNTSCTNPDHIFMGTQKDNVRDMIKKNRGRAGASHKAKKHCLRGHEYTEENTRYQNKENWTLRACRKCIKISNDKFNTIAKLKRKLARLAKCKK